MPDEPDQPTPELWEQQPGESAKHYHFFATYRDLGAANRNIVETARILGKSTAWMMNLSSKHRWTARARAWDFHLDDIARDKSEEARREMVDRHATISRRILTTVAQRIQGTPGGPGQKAVAPLDPNTLDAADLARLLQVAATLERLSRGAPTERIETSRNEQQMSPALQILMEDQELAEQAENLAIELAKRRLRKETD
jgi:hypothetical protein